MSLLKKLSVIPVIAAFATSLLSTSINANAFAGNTLINIQSIDEYGHQVTGCSYRLLDSSGTIWAEWTSGNEEKAKVTGGIYSVHSEAEMQYPTHIDYSLLGVDSSQVLGYTIKDANGTVTAESDDITKSFQLFANTTYTCIAQVINNDWTADVVVPANSLYVYDKLTSQIARARFKSLNYMSEYYDLNGTNQLVPASDYSEVGYIMEMSDGFSVGTGFGYPKSTDTKVKLYTYNIIELLTNSSGYMETLNKEGLTPNDVVAICASGDSGKLSHSVEPFVSLDEPDESGNFTFLGIPGGYANLQLWFGDIYSLIIGIRLPYETKNVSYTTETSKAEVPSKGVSLLGLPVGTYTIHQVNRAIGYENVADQTITIAENRTTTQYFKSFNKALFTLGDIEDNGTVDAVDASNALSAYAKVSTGGVSGLTDVQEKAADVNANGAVDAVDASIILTYYAKVATGSSASWD